MFAITQGPIPDKALIETYARIKGGHTDCYYVDVPRYVTLSEFIQTFFSSPVFRLERLLLNMSPTGRSTDQDIANLASGTGNTMAVWKVDAREENQLIMSAGNGPIRTWLKVDTDYPETGKTRLFFGSALAPTRNKNGEQRKLSWVFKVSLGFHGFYSQLLLSLAARRLTR